ncbi:hypothetical protein [Arthrobacter crystallopoietes]|uniref:hypothetical protein n=1 Tax=Crystallibacter crystallopoietes TaxID=37928 RepID=UPI0014868209|nr:hypothetical protein [Arthrobacter crystallopoietes]
MVRIIDDLSHLVLAYLEVVEKHGCKLSVAALNAYGTQPERVIYNEMHGVEAGRGSLIKAIISSADDEPWVSDEPFDRFFSRLHWIEVKDEMVSLTQLGKAVLQEANSPRTEGDSAIDVLIDPNNQFAYMHVMNKIGQVGECLVIDPYLDAETAVDLGQMPTVTRVLTGDGKISKLRGRFGLVMRARPDFEIRYIDRKILHDRYVVPKAGPVLVLGSSLNSIARRQGVITPLEPLGSAYISEAYEKMWGEANGLTDEVVGA